MKNVGIQSAAATILLYVSLFPLLCVTCFLTYARANPLDNPSETAWLIVIAYIWTGGPAILTALADIWLRARSLPSLACVVITSVLTPLVIFVVFRFQSIGLKEVLLFGSIAAVSSVVC